MDDSATKEERPKPPFEWVEECIDIFSLRLANNDGVVKDLITDYVKENRRHVFIRVTVKVAFGARMGELSCSTCATTNEEDDPARKIYDIEIPRLAECFGPKVITQAILTGRPFTRYIDLFPSGSIDCFGRTSTLPFWLMLDSYISRR